MQTLRPSTGYASSCSRTKAVTSSEVRTPVASPMVEAGNVTASGRVAVEDTLVLLTPSLWRRVSPTGKGSRQLVATCGDPNRPGPSMTAMPELPGLHPHDDRLLPADPAVRDLARRLYQQVRDLPIISPHGHVPVEWIEGNIPFTDPTALLLSPDHYIFRLLHAAGVPLNSLGVGDQSLTEAESRAAWRTFCEHWPLFRGTPSRFWMESVLSGIFGVTQRPGAESADAIYDRVAERLTSDEFRPRQLFKSFGIDVLATTDDPCADLADHAALAGDPSFDGRVVPTCRPDRYLEPGRPGFAALMDRLAEASGEDTGDFPGYLGALAQ